MSATLAYFEPLPPVTRNHSPARILVVDDQPINIRLLQRRLEQEGFTVDTATTGLECLDKVGACRPDLILLDIMMPEMDGFEACQRLCQEAETEDLPIIFITAKVSKEGELQGLGAGAVDYITKPIDLDETIARVRTQLRVQEVHRENLDLQRRLDESRRTAAIGAITQGIAHNLNNLLGVVVGYLDLLKSGYDSPDMVKRSVSLMDQAIQRMVTIIRHLGTIATQERVELSSHRIADLLSNAIDRFHSESETAGKISLNIDLPEGFAVMANSEQFEGILGRLLANAVEAYPRGTPADARDVEVRAAAADDSGLIDSVVITISDRGTGIPEEVLDTFYEPFITTKMSVGRGLGLTIARHAVRSIKGELTLSAREGGGTVAEIRYPVQTGPAAPQLMQRPAPEPAKSAQ